MDAYRRVFGFPLGDYYHTLGVDLSRETMEALADESHDAYLSGLAACRRLGIDRHFTAVHGLGHRLADSKMERARTLFERFATRERGTLLIGDTDHDVHVAWDLGIRVVLVGRGHQSIERPRPLAPVFASFTELSDALSDRAFPFGQAGGRSVNRPAPRTTETSHGPSVSGSLSRSVLGRAVPGRIAGSLVLTVGEQEAQSKALW